MKKVIVFLLITLSGINFSIGQEDHCDFKIYKQVFEGSKLFKNKAAKIEVGYKPHKSIIDIIKALEIFNDKEIEAFYNFPDNDYSNCIKLNRQVELLLSNDRVKEDGSYMIYYFSQVIPVSNSKKAVLSSTSIASKVYRGGKTIGLDVIYIIEKLNNEWVLTSKKPLIMS